jgi:hypothetical protein
MKIVIETIPLEKQRYPTIGDYFYEPDGTLKILITETGNDFHSTLVAIHELVEQTLTDQKGIREEDILKHDLWVETEVTKGNYPTDAEPGEHPRSPYYEEHMLAERIEKMICKHLGINFKEYNEEIFKVFNNAND